MAMYEVYKHPEFRIYRASVCSKATVFMIFVYFFTFAVPLLIVYRSNGLWIKTWTITEQPDIKYKHQILSIFDIQSAVGNVPSYVAWSTYQQFNAIHQNNLRIPLVKSREEDTNRDGKFDVLYLDMELPMRDSDNIFQATVLLFFEVKLKQLCLVTFEGMARISAYSPFAGASFSTIGDLKFKQRQHLPHNGVDNTWNVSVVNRFSLVPSDYELDVIYRNYSVRNLTIGFSEEYPIWKTGRASGDRFKLSAEIRYPETSVALYTGFWQMIKYAVVQYIAVLLIFAFICERIKLFVFSQQLIPTVTTKPLKNS